jgi:hypothetical protein
MGQHALTGRMMDSQRQRRIPINPRVTIRLAPSLILMFYFQAMTEAQTKKEMRKGDSQLVEHPCIPQAHLPLSSWRWISKIRRRSYSVSLLPFFHQTRDTRRRIHRLCKNLKQVRQPLRKEGLRNTEISSQLESAFGRSSLYARTLAMSI